MEINLDDCTWSNNAFFGTLLGDFFFNFLLSFFFLCILILNFVIFLNGSLGKLASKCEAPFAFGDLDAFIHIVSQVVD